MQILLAKGLRKTEKMKKLTKVMVAALLIMSVHTKLKAGTEVAIPTTETVQSVAVKAIIVRLEKIDAMDKSNLDSKEKKELRKEVVGLKSELKHYDNSGGAYISVGALIIIILLLIILL
jgi:hypothetical protein